MIFICLPPHPSHLTQPLDIGFFHVLKRAYAINLPFNEMVEMHGGHQQ